MKSPLDSLERRIVPRWRQSAVARKLPGGLPRSKKSPGAIFLRDAQLELDWLGEEFRANRSVPFAADLLSAAVASGNRELARDAAETVLQEEGTLPPTVVRLARHAMSGLDDAPASAGRQMHDAGSAIRTLRGRLRTYESGALDWIDLALAYVSIGRRDKAERAVQTALGLSSSNRHVLRSAARYFVHARKPDEALRTLNSAPALLSDPWLLAAEIAVSSVAGRSSRHMKHAKQLLGAGLHSSQDLSELGAAVATREAEDSAIKTAKRRMIEALNAATENTLAQADWFHHNVDLLGDLSVQARATPHAFEASASVHLYAREWQDALAEANRWAADEPFSGRPALLGSFIEAMVYSDHKAAEARLREALRASPDDPGLLNNLAFSLASLGSLDEASRALLAARGESATPALRAAMFATAGLIDLRSGKLEQGEAGYRRAIETAKSEKLWTSVAMAHALLGRELALGGEIDRGRSELNAASVALRRLPADKKPVAETVVVKCNEELESAASGERQ